MSGFDGLAWAIGVMVLGILGAVMIIGFITMGLSTIEKLYKKFRNGRK